MADDGIIKRLLIQLGFDVDETSQLRFDGALIKSTALGVAAGEAIFAGAKKAVSAVAELAEGYEKLYFASKRTGASAAEITDLSLSLRNAGIEASTTMATIDSLAQFRRTQFAADPILLGLGVKPDDLKDTTKYIKDIVDAGKRTYGDTDIGYKEFNARVQAALGGAIPEEVLNAQWKFGKPDTTAEDMEKRTGVSMNNAASAAHDMNSGLRDLDVIVKSELTPAFSLAADTVANALLRVSGDATKGNDDIVITNEEMSHTLVGRDVGFVNRMVSNEGYKDDPKVKQGIDFFMSPEGGGLSQKQAIGVVSNLIDESGLDPRKVGDNGTAFGAAQWHLDRIDAIKAGTGIDIKTASLAAQEKALAWEFKHGDLQTRAGYQKLLSEKDAGAAGYDVSRYIERPAGGWLTANARGARAVGLSNAINNTVNVTVMGGANPQQTGEAVGRGAADAISSTVRNFTQAGH